MEVLQLQKHLSIVDTAFKKLSDNELLKRYSVGDESAFRELVVRYKNSLYSFLRMFLYRDDHVEDVFQETFLQFFKSLDLFDMNRPVRPWLFMIAANKAKDAIRKLQQIHEVPFVMLADSEENCFEDFFNAIVSDNSTPAVKLEEREYVLLVREVISIMPVHYREILLLAYFNKFSYKQIADILSIPVGTVKSRLHSAVRHFAKLWSESVYH
ncbi:MAG: RNA polymerase sigma factor [Sedimentisphaerales bacterium]|nr:RNA polymerase sigma factor [Sedimentisphaerales bacterium]